MLETLEKDNLFVIPLDEERRWYRYHHLFAEVLRHHLRRTRPELVAELHRRAAEGCEQDGLIDEAIKHALAAGDAERAAELVERNAVAAVVRSEVATLARWLGALPEELLHSRPKLCVARAVTSLVGGEPDAVESYLQDAQRALAREPEEQPAEGSGGWLADPPAAIAVIRGTLARLRGDVTRVIELSRWSLTRLPEESMFLRSIVAWDLGIAQQMVGDMAQAGRIFAELVRANRAAGEPYIALIAMYELGKVRVIQGRLREAEEIYRQGLRLAAERGGSPLPAVGMVHVGLGDVLRERNELEAATRHLTEGITLCKRLGYAEPLATAYATLARVKQTQGDAPGALDAIRKAQLASPNSDVSRPFDPMAVHRARLWLERGDLAAATRWAQESTIGVEDDLSFQREVEHITLARVLVAQDSRDEALRLLEILKEAAEAGDRTGRVIEILVLQALALQAEGDTERTMSALARVLSLAEPEDYVRIFVDEGAPMAALLRRAVAKGISLDYTSRLLEAFGSTTEKPPAGPLS